MAYRTYYDKNGVILSRNDAYYKIGELRRGSYVLTINRGLGILLNFGSILKSIYLLMVSLDFIII